MFLFKTRVRFKLCLSIQIFILIAFMTKFSYEKEHNHQRIHHHHHHLKQIRSFNENNNSSKKRTVINGDYNLQRDYIAATVGKDVQLDCKMKNLANDDDKIVWLKMPKGEVLTLNGNRVTPDQRINSKCLPNMMPCWSLVITETRESDTGFYVCQTNAMQTKYIYLDIMVPPKLLTNYPVDRIDAVQSSNTSLTCEFYGKPEPLIKWFKYHNGNPKEIEKFRGYKTVNFFIHKESSSEYECVADNSIPPVISKKIFLNIQFAPIVKFLNSRVFQTRGERVIFDCHVQSNPKSKVYWFKNQTKLVESNKYIFEDLENNYFRLYINNLTDSDFDDYYLTAENEIGKSTAKIELVELPSIVLNDLSSSFTTPIVQKLSSEETNTNKNKNLRNSLNKILTDSENRKKQVSEQISSEDTYENEFIFFKTTNSLNLKQNRSTKYSSYRSNKLGNNTQTNHKLKNRKQQLENIDHTSTTSYHIFDLDNNCSILFCSKFQIIVFVFIFLIFS